MEITLALGGGGAKGNAHIGVIRRLEKEGYQIRSVAGTSMGGLVAILYASGLTPVQIEEIFTSTTMAPPCWGFPVSANYWIRYWAKRLLMI